MGAGQACSASPAGSKPVGCNSKCSVCDQGGFYESIKSASPPLILIFIFFYVVFRCIIMFYVLFYHIMSLLLFIDVLLDFYIG